MIPIERSSEKYRVESSTVIAKGDMLDILVYPPIPLPLLEWSTETTVDCIPELVETLSELEVWKL